MSDDELQASQAGSPAAARNTAPTERVEGEATHEDARGTGGNTTHIGDQHAAGNSVPDGDQPAGQSLAQSALPLSEQLLQLNKSGGLSSPLLSYKRIFLSSDLFLLANYSPLNAWRKQSYHHDTFNTIDPSSIAPAEPAHENVTDSATAVSETGATCNEYDFFNKKHSSGSQLCGPKGKALLFHGGLGLALSVSHCHTSYTPITAIRLQVRYPTKTQLFVIGRLRVFVAFPYSPRPR
jgi:hypothetical protein